MPMEDPMLIDQINTDENGCATMFIADAGNTRDPDDRLVALLTKLYSYVQYINSAQFIIDNAQAGRNAIEIRVICRFKPTAKMAAITEVSPPEEMQSEAFPLTVPVYFEHCPEIDFGPHARTNK